MYKYIVRISICMFFVFAVASLNVLGLNIQPTPKLEFKLLVEAPTDLKATSPDVGIVELTWTDNAINEECYVIERKQDDGDFVNVGYVAANETTFKDSELNMYPIYGGETYTYRVAALNNDTYSDYSNSVTITVQKANPPTQATMLIAEVVSSNAKHPIQLTWDENANNEESIEVQRAKDNGSFYLIETLTPNTNEYLDYDELELDVPYTYRIKEINKYGSSYSNYATLIKPSHAPSTPIVFSGVTRDSNTIELIWSASDGIVDGYIIGRKENGAYPSALNPTFDVPADTGNVIDSGLEPETKYSYILASYNQLYSSFIIECHTSTGPKSPTNVEAFVNVLNAVHITWENPSQIAKDFVIERKEGDGSYKQIVYLQSQDDLSYNDTTVENGESYTYRVIAYSGLTPSSPSETVTVDVETQIVVPLPQEQEVIELPLKNQKTILLQLDGQTFTVDNEVKEMDTAPVNQGGRLLVPIRYITEALGATATWVPDTQKIIIALNGTTLELWIDKNIATVNGVEVMIDAEDPEVTPMIVPPGRTLVPLRFIAESLGCAIDWDDATQQIEIIYQP